MDKIVSPLTILTYKGEKPHIFPTTLFSIPHFPMTTLTAIATQINPRTEAETKTNELAIPLESDRSHSTTTNNNIINHHL